MNWMRRLAQHLENKLKESPQSIFHILIHMSGQVDAVSDKLFQVIRWFQIQPRIEVGIYCDLPINSESEFLESLNQRGFPYRLKFRSDDIYFHPNEDHSIAVAAIRHFEKPGRVVAAILDEDRLNLESVLQEMSADNNEILLMQRVQTKNDISKSNEKILQGASYNLTDLITEQGLPPQIQYCWHGINDSDNLQEFLRSTVKWGEVDVRRNPETKQLMTRHDSYHKSPKFTGEEEQSFEECLRTFKAHNRSVKVDFKQGRSVINEVAEILHRLGFADDEIWFHGDIHKLYPNGFKKLRRLFPEATIQTTMDSFNKMIVRHPQVTRRALKTYARWGVNRFLLTWQSPDIAQILSRMDAWGYEVNFYEIPDLNNFLQVVLLLPAGITTDYNFPEWHHYGRGSGQNLQWHIYNHTHTETIQEK